MSDNINSKDFMIGTVIGGLIGASLALLFAPKSGKDLRGDINQGANQMMDKASDLKDTVQEKSLDLKDVAYEKSSDLTDTASQKGSELKKRRWKRHPN